MHLNLDFVRLFRVSWRPTRSLFLFFFLIGLDISDEDSPIRDLFVDPYWTTFEFSFGAGDKRGLFLVSTWLFLSFSRLSLFTEVNFMSWERERGRISRVQPLWRVQVQLFREPDSFFFHSPSYLVSLRNSFYFFLIFYGATATASQKGDAEAAQNFFRVHALFLSPTCKHPNHCKTVIRTTSYSFINIE